MVGVGIERADGNLRPVSMLIPELRAVTVRMENATGAFRRLPSHRLMREGPHRAVTLERWGAAPVSRDGLGSDFAPLGACVRASTGLIGGQRARRLQTKARL